MQVAKSARLELRTLEPGDQENLLPYFSDPEVCRFIPWEPRDLSGVQEFIQKLTGVPVPANDGDAFVVGMVHPAHGVIGQLNMFFRSKLHGMAEVGYVINPAFSKQGYASEGLAAFIDWIFATLPIRRVTAQIDQRNTASSAVVKSLGFRLEGTEIEREWFKGQYCTMETFAVLEREWRSGSAVNS